jgi:hypothetical protein
MRSGRGVPVLTGSTVVEPRGSTNDDI